MERNQVQITYSRSPEIRVIGRGQRQLPFGAEDCQLGTVAFCFGVTDAESLLTGPAAWLARSSFLIVKLKALPAEDRCPHVGYDTSQLHQISEIRLICR